MLFWCLTNFHRCTFGFPIPFIDVLLGFCEGPSMYFWVSVKVHRCSFGSLWSFIDVVFISFSLNMIDAPLVSNLSLRHSSMLFGICFSPFGIHRCTQAFSCIPQHAIDVSGGSRCVDELVLGMSIMWDCVDELVPEMSIMWDPKRGFRIEKYYVRATLCIDEQHKNLYLHQCILRLEVHWFIAFEVGNIDGT